jgi:DNA primase
MRIKTLTDCLRVSENQEALDMLQNKHLLSASLKTFGFRYLPANSKCRTDLLWERLILPIHDCRGNIIAYAGRKLNSGFSSIQHAYRSKYLDASMAEARIAKWDNSKWLNEPYEKSKNLFNIHRAYAPIINKGYAIIVEGYFDVVGLFNKNIYNVVATCGTNLSKYQSYFLKTLCDHCVILYDGDSAGYKASENASNMLKSVNVGSTIIYLDEGLDPDDFIAHKNSVKFTKLLDDFVKERAAYINLT